MPHSLEDSITKIEICRSLLINGVSPEKIPVQLGIHRATVYRWKKRLNRLGINEFKRRYRAAKKGHRQPRKTGSITKVRIFDLRQEYRNCCGEKLRFLLRERYGTTIAVSTIYRVLGEKFQLRSKWKKYSKRGFVKKGSKPREVIQTDTVDFGGIYAFTAIDTFTKEVSVIMRPSLTSADGAKALEQQLVYFKRIDHIQRDGGPEFKKDWHTFAEQHIPSIRTARPYKKNEQTFIERFNGILRKECLGYVKYQKDDVEKVQKKVDEYLMYYHTKRPHLSLSLLTPAQFTKLCRI